MRNSVEMCSARFDNHRVVYTLRIWFALKLLFTIVIAGAAVFVLAIVVVAAAVSVVVVTVVRNGTCFVISSDCRLLSVDCCSGLIGWGPTLSGLIITFWLTTELDELRCILFLAVSLLSFWTEIAGIACMLFTFLWYGLVDAVQMLWYEFDFGNKFNFNDELMLCNRS